MMFVFSFVVLLTNNSWSQNIFNNQQSLEFRPKAGFLIAHHENMAHLVKSHMYSGEIAYVFNTIGQNYWQKKYKYPSYGLSLYYLYTGNQRVLGNALGTFAFIKLPFVNREHIQFNIKIGAGLGYLSRHFDQYTNPKNVAIGTHLNALINFSFDLIYKWSKGYIGFGIDFTHLSNGGTILPNLGLNMPSLSIIYGIVTKKASLLDPPEKEVNKNWSFQGTGIFSLHQTRPGGGRVHPVYGIAAYMNKRFNEKTGMFLGFDFLYDDALNHGPNSKAPFDWRIVQTGFLVAYELNIDRLKMYLGMGIYLKNDFNPNGLFYHKLGFKYEFSRHFFANIAVKTHWAQASYVEFGLGYKIFVSK